MTATPQTAQVEALLPCPFCGGPVALERANVTRDHIFGERHWYGIVCRNTGNRGGSCAMEQRPSASKEAAIDRWNMRATPQAAVPAMSEQQIEALAHRKAWKYKYSSDPAHSDTYTFNRTCLLDFARALGVATQPPASTAPDAQGDM